jgi:protein-S-isoprenylcysteine O-methyltransferase Ste14
MSSLQVVSVVAFLLCFGSFTWALQGGFFTSTGTKNFGITLTRLFGLFFMLLHLAVLILTPTTQLALGTIGTLLYLGALLLFWSAIAANWKRPLALAFTREAPHHLTATGPYRYIRHPFYTSYLLGWLAGYFATGNAWTLAAPLVMGVLYVLAARSEERLFLKSGLATNYESYKREAGMFLPNLKFLLLASSTRTRLLKKTK